MRTRVSGTPVPYRPLGTILCLCLLAFGATAEPLIGPRLFGLQPDHLDASFWVARQADAERPRLTAGEIDAMNADLRARDSSMTRLDQLPLSLPADIVRARIEVRSGELPADRFDRAGQRLDAAARDALRASLALQRIAPTVSPRFALVVRRAALRTYPTHAPLYNPPDQHDIDRLQESALFPGTAVAALHRSADQHWWFVVSERYAAWIEDAALAFGTRAEVLDFATRQPALTVLGAYANTVVSPEAGALSNLRLDMGVRLPLLTAWPTDTAVHGQLPLAHWVVELPRRGANGELQRVATLIARAEPVKPHALAYSPANVIRQAFRFLGERYGWGHALDARDCSGFVSEVYASMGVLLPRNSGDQAASPAFDGVDLVGLDLAARDRALAEAAVGDLLFLPGHVMLVIGRIDDALWLIHDAHGLHVAENGATVRKRVNGVVVTPLNALRNPDGTPLADQLTRIQRIRPSPSAQP